MRYSFRVMRFLLFAALCLFSFQTSCFRDPGDEPRPAKVQAQVPEPDLKSALGRITQEELLEHITTLASDDFEGRAPGTRGEELTVDYLVSQFKKLGLEPGNPDGTYIQRVPLLGIRGRSAAHFSADGRRLDLVFPRDGVAVTRLNRPQIEVKDSEMVFAGYGVIAPEYGWDDFKGVDVTGKTVVMLINDPPVRDPQNPARLDEKVFGGSAMTYYGRWTYKYEIAAQQGAAAAILVHETGPAGYPYAVLVNSRGREVVSVDFSDTSEPGLPVESWITERAASRLFALAGTSLARLKEAALSRGFRPIPLGVKASFSLSNRIRRIDSRNVVAMLPGSDARLKNEHVIYMAHWDHLGKNEQLKGDSVYNGAVDNASGTAGLLEIASAFARLNVRPARSVLFLALTAEEKGLLGAKYYTANPLYPLDQTLAAINMDCLNLWGATRDITVIGLDSSPFHELARETARLQGRRLEPDHQPEKGFFYRSDHFEFVKKGIPALYTDAGVDMVGRPAEYGKQKRGRYAARDYHKVSDEVKPDWDLAGAVEDLQFLFLVGHRVAESGLPVTPDDVFTRAAGEATTTPSSRKKP